MTTTTNVRRRQERAAARLVAALANPDHQFGTGRRHGFDHDSYNAVRSDYSPSHTADARAEAELCLGNLAAKGVK